MNHQNNVVDVVDMKLTTKEWVHVKMTVKISLIMNHPEQNKGISEIEIHRLTDWDKLKVAILSAHASGLGMASAAATDIAKSKRRSKRSHMTLRFS